jgi:predicted  nucleic acid-binding Zn-ribbon protein
MYVEDVRGRDLHDKHTLGQQLDDGEKIELQAWYDRKDREEAALFEATALRRDETLRARIAETERLIQQLQERIQRQRKENEALEAEIRLLQAARSERVATAA